MALTETKLRNLKSIGHRLELPDRDGLALRLSQKGRMTWTVVYRVRAKAKTTGLRGGRLAGAKQRISLGEYPTLTLSAAREMAAAVRRRAREGVDPADVHRLKQTAAPTVSDLLDTYTTDHLKRNLKSGDNVEKLLRLHVLPKWADREIRAIARGDLVTLLESVRVPTKCQISDKSSEVVRGGPGAAAEVRKWTRAMFQFAVDTNHLAVNPFLNVRNRDKQTSRARVLSMEELRAIWKVAEELAYPWGPFFQLLMLTGARRNEWASSQRNWLVQDLSRMEIPAQYYKTERPQVIPLSKSAQAIVSALPAHELGPFLFSSTSGQRPISGFSKVKARFDESLGTELKFPIIPWVIHDLRRSMATHMERIGIKPHIIEVCLGHTLSGVAGVYRRYQYLPEKMDALSHWAEEILGSR